MERFNRNVVAYPWVYLGCVVLVTFLFFTQLSKLTMETDATAMLDKSDAAYLDNEEVKEVFNARDMLIVGVVNRGEGGVYNPESLLLVQKISDYLDSLEGVMDDEVTSFYTQNNILGEDDEMIVEPFIDDEAPESLEEARLLRDAVHKNDMFLGLLASEDDEAVMVMAKLESEEDLKAMNRGKDKIYYDLEAWIEKEDLGKNQIFVAGRPALEGLIGHYMQQDLAIMMPIVVLVVVLVLFITLRSVRGIVLPLLVVVFSVFWTLGLEGLLGVPIYTITNIIPILLIAIGSADGIHILSCYREICLRYPEMDSKETVIATMDEMWSPVVMTSLTTTAGFMALASSRMVPLKMLGIFTGVGVMAAMIFSLVLIPAALALMKPVGGKMRGKVRGEDGNHSHFGRMLDLWGETIHNQRYLVLGISGLVFILSLFLTSWIIMDASFLANFKQDSPIVIAEKVMNAKFQGTVALNVVVEGDRDGALKEPSVLKAMAAFQKDIEELPEVGGSISLADFMARMNLVMNSNDPAFDRVPDQKSLIAKYLMLYSGGPDDFDEYVDYDYRQANIRAMLKSDHSPILKKVLERAKELGKKHFGPLPGIKYKMAGNANVSYSFINAIIDSQINSLFISLFVVFVLTSLMFKSPVAGIYNALPIAAAIALNFGIMGVLDIPLEFSTAIISAIAIGIGIDYAIHFLAKYKMEAEISNDEVELNKLTMQTSGRAIFSNAVVVISGFLVLFFSKFPPMIKMGALIGLNMFTCFLASVTLLPALINVHRPRFIFNQSKTPNPDSQDNPGDIS